MLIYILKYSTKKNKMKTIKKAHHYMSLVFQKRRKKLTCQIVREFFIKKYEKWEKS